MRGKDGKLVFGLDTSMPPHLREGLYPSFQAALGDLKRFIKTDVDPKKISNKVWDDIFYTLIHAYFSRYTLNVSSLYPQLQV